MNPKNINFAVRRDAEVLPRAVSEGRPDLGNRFLNMHDALRLTSLGKTYFFKLIAEGKFPQPVKLGRRSAWPEAEVLSWMQERIAERDALGSPCKRRQKPKPRT
jgi:prophage regulatory protein